MTGIVLATEDQLSENVGLRLVREANLIVGQCLGLKGNGYLRSKVPAFCAMAVHQPVVLITDLDRITCPLKLLADWFGGRECPPRLTVRVAVREIESWLLADHEAIRQLVGSRVGRLPNEPDNLPDPKQVLLALATRSARSIREELVVRRGQELRQGIGYNAILAKWIGEMWSPNRAAERSPSLGRMRTRLKALSN